MPNASSPSHCPVPTKLLDETNLVVWHSQVGDSLQASLVHNGLRQLEELIQDRRREAPVVNDARFISSTPPWNDRTGGTIGIGQIKRNQPIISVTNTSAFAVIAIAGATARPTRLRSDNTRR